MKNLTYCLALLMVGFSTNMFAQARAIASAAVNIVMPISITKSVDMNFGTVVTGTTEAGTAGTEYRWHTLNNRWCNNSAYRWFTYSSFFRCYGYRKLHL